MVKFGGRFGIRSNRAVSVLSGILVGFSWLWSAGGYTVDAVMKLFAGGAFRRGVSSGLVCGFGAGLLAVPLESYGVEALPWAVGIVVNNGTLMPGESQVFNAYNQPSINGDGLVVFRARGKGGEGQGQPPAGIYARQLPALPFGPLSPSLVAARGSLVPQPNTRTPPSSNFPPSPASMPPAPPWPFAASPTPSGG